MALPVRTATSRSGGECPRLGKRTNYVLCPSLNTRNKAEVLRTVPRSFCTRPRWSIVSVNPASSREGRLHLRERRMHFHTQALAIARWQMKALIVTAVLLISGATQPSTPIRQRVVPSMGRTRRLPDRPAGRHQTSDAIPASGYLSSRATRSPEQARMRTDQIEVRRDPETLRQSERPLI